ncbi:MAG: glycosyl transferase, group 1 [Candidatus Eremiobacteraeota bacterium]|nr:glycosyl transferase, group 1 [Candidatus Eremiobacteraeota bacterium]
MKLAYLTALFPFAHAEQFFEEEVRSLSREADVVVVPARPPSQRACYDDVGTALHLPLLSARVLALAAREALRSPLRALAAFGRIAFDPGSSLRARAVNLAAFPKALAVARELRRQRVDHVHAAWLTTPATIAWVVWRMTGIPFSATAHQHDVFARNLIRRKARDGNFVRVISARNAGHLRDQLAPALRDRVIVGHLGVAVPAAAAVPEPRTPRILCAARLCSWKGHADLLAALALLRDRGVAFTCDLAGDGEIRAEVAATIERLALGERVRMLGNVPHPELVARVNAAAYDVLALASTERFGEHEGIPVAVMEAMAAALPVVVTRTGSLPELVEPAFGALVPQRDPHALADALEELLRDRETRLSRGRAGRERIIAEFETRATSRTLLGWIERAR